MSRGEAEGNRRPHRPPSTNAALENMIAEGLSQPQAPPKRKIPSLQAKFLPGPNSISHAEVYPDPDREGAPTMFIIGGMDHLAKLAAELWVQSGGNLSPECCYDQVLDFFERIGKHRQKLLDENAVTEESQPESEQNDQEPSSIIIP